MANFGIYRARPRSMHITLFTFVSPCCALGCFAWSGSTWAGHIFGGSPGEIGTLPSRNDGRKGSGGHRHTLPPFKQHLGAGSRRETLSASTNIPSLPPQRPGCSPNCTSQAPCRDGPDVIRLRSRTSTGQYRLCPPPLPVPPGSLLVLRGVTMRGDSHSRRRAPFIPSRTAYVSLTKESSC